MRALSPFLFTTLLVSSGYGQIVGGEDAGTCEAPSSVAMILDGGLCTGTLVHPQIVTYAAHCGSNVQAVAFGENINDAAHYEQVEHCRVYNAQYTETDYAYCKLARPIENVPITPPLYGCELDQLQQGKGIVIAGFGSDGVRAGTKHLLNHTLSQVSSQSVVIGGGGTGAWQGDSGGPAYIQLNDGGYRAFGIASRCQGPGGACWYGRIDVAVPWIEEQSGIDITPCHNVDGTWNPTEQCGNFATSLTAEDTWDSFCAAGGAETFLARTCGDSYPDPTPPEVEIQLREEFVPDQQGTLIFATKEDIDRVERVEVFIGGELAATLTEQPFELSGTFGEGEYSVKAIAYNGSGDTGEDAVKLAVGDVGGCSSHSFPLAYLWIPLGFFVLFRRKRATPSI